MSSYDSILIHAILLGEPEWQNYGVTDKMIDASVRPIFHFVSQHQSKYNKPPSRREVRKHFPNFKFYKVTEPFKYYVDQIIKEFKLTSVRNAMADLTDAMTSNKPDEAIKILQNSAKETETIFGADVAADYWEGLKYAREDIDKAEFISAPLPFGDPVLDSDLIGMDYGEWILIAGDTACLAGDTVVRVNRAGRGFKITMEELEKKINGVSAAPGSLGGGHLRGWDLSIETKIRSYVDGGIRLNTIRGVCCSGVKKVYEVTLANGFSVTATGDHRIMTKHGWVRVQNLTRTDEVMIDTLVRYKKTGEGATAVRQQYNMVKVGKYYRGIKQWLATKGCYRARVSRLVYEAELNGMTLEEFKRATYAPNELQWLSHSLVVHHVDGEAWNNVPENLVALTKVAHHKVHVSGYKGFKHGIPEYSRFVSAVCVGNKKTYDIECAGPHNFVANNIVVHNSGKSWLLFKWAYELAIRGHNILVVSLELSQKLIQRRLHSIAAKVNYERLRRGQLTDEEKERLVTEAEKKRDSFFKIIGVADHDFSEGHLGSVDVLQSKIRRYKPDILLVDGIYLGMDMDEWSSTAKYANDFHRMLQSERMPAIATTQLKSTADPADPKLKDLAFTSAFKQATDYVFLIGKDEEMRRNHEAAFVVAKAREASDYQKYILKFDPGALINLQKVTPETVVKNYKGAEKGLGKKVKIKRK